jgi:hypothetical protein
MRTRGDAPEGAVGQAVPATVQAVAVGSARRHRDRRGTAQPREGGLGPQPLRVVPGGDQELPGAVYADARQGEQARGGQLGTVRP